MNLKSDFKCILKVLDNNLPCGESECRHWINFKEDLNCTHICIRKHGALKLQEIGNRLYLSAARIKQIEQETLKKISKNKAITRFKE